MGAENKKGFSILEFSKSADKVIAAIAFSVLLLVPALASGAFVVAAGSGITYVGVDRYQKRKSKSRG